MTVRYGVNLLCHPILCLTNQKERRQRGQRQEILSIRGVADKNILELALV